MQRLVKPQTTLWFNQFLLLLRLQSHLFILKVTLAYAGKVLKDVDQY